LYDLREGKQREYIRGEVERIEKKKIKNFEKKSGEN
jgi:hypothetical protein